MSPLNPTAASLLGFLHNGSMTGWELSQTALTVIGSFWSLTRSQVYRELQRMAGEGLVEAGTPGTRDARPYALTDQGRTAFAEWAAQPPAAENIRFPLLLTVALGAHVDPAVLQHHLADHRAIHAQRLAEYEAMDVAAAEAGDPVDPWSMATLAFGLRYERAVMDWFEALPDLLPED
ncbi:MAG TPA: PadR family transcriptional regulator [Euzebya sp.]|nr:PadR family transcriptional regulator [Euzebya sp.]